jgi:AcrR family transcriptional regulator
MAEKKTAKRPHHARRRDERTRQPTEIRRGLIIAAARAVLAERGVVNTTVRDIATASEVSLGTVTYHFTGIAEILAEVLQGEMTRFYQPILADAAAVADADGALRTVIDGFFAADERTWQHWRLWLDFWSLSAHDEVRANWQADAYQRWRGDVRTILVRGMDNGEFAFDDLDIALTEFLAVFDGLAGQAFLPGSTVGPPQARAHLHGYVDRRLRATANKPRRRTARGEQHQ